MTGSEGGKAVGLGIVVSRDTRDRTIAPTRDVAGVNVRLDWARDREAGSLYPVLGEVF